ncbi:MAG: 4-hydroxy-3-methylbut-2-enyl diphosphate reductase [Nitratireductor sp.]|nr:4-hydroxy-3-methylbut-2-enyl diphosphate reductase [Nitratireductor sp.]
MADRTEPATQPLTLRLCGPRGFCAGVDRAIQMVVLALKKYGAPVYVRHEIVHNRYVVEGLEAKGAVFVKELDQIPPTGQPVIFSAHGVPRSVPADASARNLFYLDATCPLVSKVHKQALRHLKHGRHVLLIGHAGHPEVIGTMGQVTDGDMSLIESVEQAANYVPADPEMLGYVTQTTLSVDDTAAILEKLRERFPALADPAAESICYATTNRQEVVKLAARDADHFLIVGAPNSSNSMRLVEVAKRAGARRAKLVQGVQDIPWDELAQARIVGLSAGASAPEILVNAIIEAFRQKRPTTVELAETVREDEEFPVARDLRDIDLSAGDMAFVNGE